MDNSSHLSRRAALQMLGVAGAQFLLPGSVFAQGFSVPGTHALGVAAHALAPRFISDRLSDAFLASTTEEALAALTDGHDVKNHTDLNLKLPEVAEQGSEVLVQVDAPIPGTEHISILVPSNHEPLVSVTEVPKLGEAYVSMRMRVGASTNVIALAHNQSGTIYQTQRKILVTSNGCA